MKGVISYGTNDIIYLKGRNFRGKKFSRNLISRIEAKISRVLREFNFTIEPKSKVSRNLISRMGKFEKENFAETIFINFSN